MCTKNQAISILGEVYSACSAIFNKDIKDAYLRSEGERKHGTDHV